MELKQSLPPSVTLAPDDLRLRGLVHNARTRRIIPTINPRDEHLFRYLLSIGLPFVVKGVDLGAGFQPDDLDRFYGQNMVQVFDSRRPATPSNMRFGDFLAALQVHNEEHSLKVRVRHAAASTCRLRPVQLAAQDFPPSGSFREDLCEQNTNFQNRLPMRDMTCETGLENLAAHWPVASSGSSCHVACKPDLGMWQLPSPSTPPAT